MSVENIAKGAVNWYTGYFGTILTGMGNWALSGNAATHHVQGIEDKEELKMGTIIAQRLVCDIRYPPTLDLYVQTHTCTLLKRASECLSLAVCGVAWVALMCKHLSVTTQSMTELGGWTNEYRTNEGIDDRSSGNLPHADGVPLCPRNFPGFGRYPTRSHRNVFHDTFFNRPEVPCRRWGSW